MLLLRALLCPPLPGQTLKRAMSTEETRKGEAATKRWRREGGECQLSMQASRGEPASSSRQCQAVSWPPEPVAPARPYTRWHSHARSPPHTRSCSRRRGSSPSADWKAGYAAGNHYSHWCSSSSPGSPRLAAAARPTGYRTRAKSSLFVSMLTSAGV